jgi:hypothetical protein
MPPPTSQGCCAHDHDCEEAECGPAYALGDRVDASRVRCLNAEGPPGAAAAAVLKRAWATRTDPCPPPGPLRSADDDPELLIHIPFEGGACKIKAICIIGGEQQQQQNNSAPKKLRAFVNRDDLDFQAVRDLPPTQEWDLQADGNSRGLIEYPTRAALFSGVHSLDLHIPSSFAVEEDCQCVVQFVGLKGEWASRERRAVEAVYEARAIPGDNPKIPGLENQGGWTA